MKRYIALLLFFTLATSLMVGCDPVETEETGGATKGTADDTVNAPLELIVILGTHQNAWLSLEELAEEDSEFRELLYRTIEFGKNGNKYTAKCHLKVIVCDGSPSEVELKKPNGKELELYQSDVSEGYIKNTYPDELVDDIVEALQGDGVWANDDEVDLVAALREASRKFETTDRERMIYIMDTGLCTVGPMALDVNDAGEVDLVGPPKPTADELMLGLKSGDFPSLSGVRVKFRNFADFCGEQEILDDDVLIEAFQDVWKAYLVKCGVENPEVHYDGSEYDKSVDKYVASNYPKVSVVKFRKALELPPPRPASAPFDSVLDANLILNGESVGGFDKNIHVPNDVEAAKQIAAEKKMFLDQILQIYPDCVFYVIGSSSYVRGEFRDTDLDAEGRANTVAEYLIDAGVPADRIIPIDAGSHKLPWRNADELEEKDENQVVAIIPSYRVEIIKVLNAELPDRIPAPEVTE